MIRVGERVVIEATVTELLQGTVAVRVETPEGVRRLIVADRIVFPDVPPTPRLDCHGFGSEGTE